jgi:hypothetical protein
MGVQVQKKKREQRKTWSVPIRRSWESWLTTTTATAVIAAARIV